LDLEIANSKVKKPINLKFFDFKSSRLSLLDKYIPIFITEFKNANVVEIKKFKKVSDYVYKIYGNLLDRWLLSLDGDVSFDVTIIYDFSEREKEWITIKSDFMIRSFKINLSPLWKVYTEILKENYILNEKIISSFFGISI